MLRTARTKAGFVKGLGMGGTRLLKFENIQTAQAADFVHTSSIVIGLSRGLVCCDVAANTSQDQRYVQQPGCLEAEPPVGTLHKYLP